MADEHLLMKAKEGGKMEGKRRRRERGGRLILLGHHYFIKTWHSDFHIMEVGIMGI